MLKDKHYIKYVSIAIAGGLVISLILNFTLISKINDLQYQVNNLSATQFDIRHSVENQVSEIQNVLNDFTKEQSWISSIDMEVNTKNVVDGQANATFKWQVKEFESGSEVVFNYAYGNSEDFKTVQAEELQNGLFQADVPITVDLEPVWEIGVAMSDSDKQQEEVSKKEMEEKMAEHTLKYFVSVSTDDKVQSSQVYTEHLGYFGTSLYGVILLDLISNKDQFNIHLMNDIVDESSVFIEEAYLLKYQGETLLGEAKLMLDDENYPHDVRIRNFHLDQIEKQENMRLVVKVVYSNGKTFEKQVY
jgi:hypothetical protein